MMRPRFPIRVRILASSAALIALGGCATFGGNVKGTFSCAAPDGICAPTSSIDDRALAMIAGEAGSAGAAPAGSYPEARPKTRLLRTAAIGARVQLDRADPRRTQERVLRIVFQPYIDEHGRLHEASAIHAVVQAGEWQQQTLATATAIPARDAQAAAPDSTSLAEAVDRADAGAVDVSAIDPDLPDPAAVAAARARAADPVAAIKNDVAARLAPKAGRTPPAAARRKRTAAPAGVVTSPISGPTASSSSAGAKDVGTPGAVSPLKPVAGAEATARIKASPDFQARANVAEDVARRASAPSAGPDKAVVGKATLRANDFPSTVPGDK